MDQPLHFLFLLLLFLSSCSPAAQLYQVSSPEVQSYEEDVFAYENEDIAIAYDFWTNGGVMLFSITNKTDKNVFIDFQQSQFVINQDTLDYHEDFFELENTTHRPSPNTNYQSDFSPVVRLAPQKSQTIEGYPITFNWRRSIKKGRSYTFTPSSSPYQFSNIIVYSFDENFAHKTNVQNTFAISEFEEIKGKQWKAFHQSSSSKANRFYVKRERDETAGLILAEIVIAIFSSISFSF